MRRHIYLGGIKHSGKTSIGERLSARLSLPFYDLDDLILKRIPSRCTIRSFYAIYGKKLFQLAELLSLQQLLPTPGGAAVISLGGGACDNEPLMKLVKQSGRLIYLKVDEETLWQRIEAGGTPTFLDGDDPRASFSAVYEERHARYSLMCDLLIDLSDGLSLEQATDRVVARLGLEE